MLRDQHIKRELTDMQVVDGAMWGVNEYMIKGLTRGSPTKRRLLYPCHLDAELDLQWYVKGLLNFKTSTFLALLILFLLSTFLSSSLHHALSQCLLVQRPLTYSCFLSLNHQLGFQASKIERLLEEGCIWRK